MVSHGYIIWGIGRRQTQESVSSKTNSNKPSRPPEESAVRMTHKALALLMAIEIL